MKNNKLFIKGIVTGITISLYIEYLIIGVYILIYFYDTIKTNESCSSYLWESTLSSIVIVTFSIVSICLKINDFDIYFYYFLILGFINFLLVVWSCIELSNNCIEKNYLWYYALANTIFAIVFGIIFLIYPFIFGICIIFGFLKCLDKSIKPSLSNIDII